MATDRRLPTIDEVVAALDEIRWSVAFDCLHFEQLTDHGRWVLLNAPDTLRLPFSGVPQDDSQ